MKPVGWCSWWWATVPALGRGRLHDAVLSLGALRGPSPGPLLGAPCAHGAPQRPRRQMLWLCPASHQEAEDTSSPSAQGSPLLSMSARLSFSDSPQSVAAATCPRTSPVAQAPFSSGGRVMKAVSRDVC